METTKLSWSVETHSVFILFVIDFEKKYFQKTKHWMHIRQKIFISVHIIGFCAPISFWRLKILSNPISWVPFERAATFNFRKYALMHSDKIFNRKLSAFLKDTAFTCARCRTVLFACYWKELKDWKYVCNSF